MLFTEWKVFRVPFLSLSFSVGLMYIYHISSKLCIPFSYQFRHDNFFYVALLDASQTSINLSSKHTCESDIVISVL